MPFCRYIPWSTFRALLLTDDHCRNIAITLIDLRKANRRRKLVLTPVYNSYFRGIRARPGIGPFNFQKPTTRELTGSWLHPSLGKKGSYFLDHSMIPLWSGERRVIRTAEPQWDRDAPPAEPERSRQEAQPSSEESQRSQKSLDQWR